jgi:RecJ-like exonuclease
MKIYLYIKDVQKEEERKGIIEEIEELGYQVLLNHRDGLYWQEAEIALILNFDEEEKEIWRKMAKKENKKIFFSLKDLEDYTYKNQKWFPGRCCQ